MAVRGAKRCSAKTQAGRRCSRRAVEAGLCSQHMGSSAAAMASAAAAALQARRKPQAVPERRASAAAGPKTKAPKGRKAMAVSEQPVPAAPRARKAAAQAPGAPAQAAQAEPSIDAESLRYLCSLHRDGARHAGLRFVAVATSCLGLHVLVVFAALALRQAYVLEDARESLAALLAQDERMGDLDLETLEAASRAGGAYAALSAEYQRLGLISIDTPAGLAERWTLPGSGYRIPELLRDSAWVDRQLAQPAVLDFAEQEERLLDVLKRSGQGPAAEQSPTERLTLAQGSLAELAGRHPVVAAFDRLTREQPFFPTDLPFDCVPAAGELLRAARGLDVTLGPDPAPWTGEESPRLAALVKAQGARAEARADDLLRGERRSLLGFELRIPAMPLVVLGSWTAWLALGALAMAFARYRGHGAQAQALQARLGAPAAQEQRSGEALAGVALLTVSGLVLAACGALLVAEALRAASRGWLLLWLDLPQSPWLALPIYLLVTLCVLRGAWLLAGSAVHVSVRRAMDAWAQQADARPTLLDADGAPLQPTATPEPKGADRASE